MSRPIKFRGMTLGGDWVYGNLSELKQKVGHVDPGFYISNSVGLPFAYQIRPETRGEFTGLHDKNGREIWEGDIVMVLDRDWVSCSGCHKNPREHMLDISLKYPVVFENGAFTLKSDKPNKFDNEYDYVPLYKEYGRDLFEVLGNRFENPELLK